MTYACRRARTSGPGGPAPRNRADRLPALDRGRPHQGRSAPSEAEQILQRDANQVNKLTGNLPILYFREGERRDELLHLIKEEPSISILVLAASTGPEGPGPLVTHLGGQGVG